MSNVIVLLIIIGVLALPLLIGMIRSHFNTNQFYGDEMNKKKNKRTKRNESYEKTSNASKGEQFYND